MTRKGEVEKLIQDMKSANLESLTISPPEESKTFLDGKLKHFHASASKLLSYFDNLLSCQYLKRIINIFLSNLYLIKFSSFWSSVLNIS